MNITVIIVITSNDIINQIHLFKSVRVRSPLFTLAPFSLALRLFLSQALAHHNSY